MENYPPCYLLTTLRYRVKLVVRCDTKLTTAPLTPLIIRRCSKRIGVNLRGSKLRNMLYCPVHCNQNAITGILINSEDFVSSWPHVLETKTQFLVMTDLIFPLMTGNVVLRTSIYDNIGTVHLVV